MMNMRVRYNAIFLCGFLLVVRLHGIDFFGDEIIGKRDSHLIEQFEYGIQNARVTSATLLTGSVSTSNSMAVLATGALLGGFAAIQSNRYIRYQSTRQAYAVFSVKFSAGLSGTNQWMGLFDVNDGFAVGYSGTQFSLLYRNSVTGSVVDTITPQASFNGDTLDGTGASGINLDPTKLNIFRISYSWLGVVPIQFEVMDSSGTFVPFHTIIQVNTLAMPALSIPQLPMRAEVASVLLAGNVQLSTAGWHAGIVDEPHCASNGRTFVVTNTIAGLASALGEVHLVTIQNPSVLNGKTNKIEVKICMLGGGGLDTSTKAVGMRLLRNATVVGASFSPVSSGNSIMNVSTAGVYTVLTGTQITVLAGTTDNNSIDVTYLSTPTNSIDIIILPGETVTITAQVTGLLATATIIGIIGWDERF